MSDFLSTVRNDAPTSYAARICDDTPIVIQGTWLWVPDTLDSQIIAGVFNNSSNALNDEVKYTIFLKPGRYQLTVLAAKQNLGGQSTIYLNGAEIGQFNCFSSPKEFNVRFDFDVYIGETKNHDLNFKVTGTSGLGYGLFLTMFAFRRVL